MVIARLWGGLGNQFFQYAAGYSLAQKLRTTLLLDPLRCDLDRNRPYELHHFQISGRLWTAREKKCVESVARIARPVDDQTSSLAKWLKTAAQPFLTPWFSYVEDQYCGFQPQVFASRGHVYMAGTWASANYFEEYSDAIRRQFTLAQTPDEENQRMLDKIASQNAIGVHVRRGDYVSVPETSQRHGLCGLDYYQRAFQYLTDHVSNPAVFIFSDDPAWVRENLCFPCPTTFVTHNVGNKNYLDLQLMAACRHFIIANSTFSWWGAWLSAADGKIVVAPKRWTVDPKGTDDPVLSHWVRL